MVERSTLYCDDVDDALVTVDAELFGGSGSVADKGARRTILAGLRDVERDIGRSPFYLNQRKRALSAAARHKAPRDLLFSLRPQMLTADEVVELEAFRAKGSRARDRQFPSVHSED